MLIDYIEISEGVFLTDDNDEPLFPIYDGDLDEE